MRGEPRSEPHEGKKAEKPDALQTGIDLEG
jgi:hypothetical protein